ncbi:hypothetical protein FB567DRAFT_87903 [Paraphoma chrysanthemicola]|uniref:MARVEL domain-containing protein n=1 Tax=Paraphoma chrysanthemicola TaxID=798071 RepID=A0A8K0VX00_9PLEO|nr:hypothetical protein FB567DRAFT_87903 [Paraphoma chrysanthemicola]
MQSTNVANGQTGTPLPVEYPRPDMPPPPYFKTHFITPSSFKAAINTKLDKPLVSLFRLSVRLLQFAFTLASGVSYAVELSKSEISERSAFIYAQVLFGFTLVNLVTDSITVRHYRFTWMVEWTLAILWFVCFAIFYQAYLEGMVEPEYRGTNLGRMTRAVWCDLVNALLWSGSAVFSSVMCCTGVKASIKNKWRRRKQEKEDSTMMHKIGQMESGVIGARSN